MIESWPFWATWDVMCAISCVRSLWMIRIQKIRSKIVMEAIDKTRTVDELIALRPMIDARASWWNLFAWSYDSLYPDPNESKRTPWADHD